MSAYHKKKSNVRMTLTMRNVRAIIVVVEKQYVTYSECVIVALGIQREMRMRPITSSTVACLALQYYATFFHT